ncbi:MAG: DUF285 domain-containing protein [Bacilli bacterium]|nr:DUF285 domain-containing protein [Bacilli bacterium]
MSNEPNDSTLVNNISFSHTHETINISANLPTTNASDMKRVFAGCTSITEIDVSGVDTSNVRSMYLMFRKGSKVTDVDLSSFDTSNVENMLGIFTAATGIKTVTFGENFDTTKVHNYSNMFNGATALTTINARFDFNITSDAIANKVFYNNSKLVGAKGTTYATNYSSSHTNGETPESSVTITQEHLIQLLHSVHL